MARKATDLLDVFRFSDDGGSGKDESGKRRGGGRTSRSKSAKKSKRSAKSKKGRRFEGVSLNRRQLMLASSALLLLVVLSFVLGLSTGRPGAGEASPALQRTSTSLVMIRGHLPLVDPATQKAVDPARVARVLKRDYGIPDRNLRMRLGEGGLVIEVGPFHSVERARDYLRKSGLELAHIHMEDPFRWPKYVPYRAGR